MKSSQSWQARHRFGTRHALTLASTVFLASCGGGGGGGGNDAGPPPFDPCANPGVEFDVGSDVGHATPLAAGPGEARAGRVQASQLPRTPSGLGTWEGGDFVLANDRIAMVIEDADDSDLYDPWGGKPVGMANVEGGALVDPSDFGEMLLFTFGPSTVVTEHVGVLADGSAGGVASVRAEGRINAIPFVLGLIGVYWQGQTFRDVVTRFAIDYELAPDSNHVDVFIRARHADPQNPLWNDGPEAYGFMYSDRLLAFQPTGIGFTSAVLQNHEWLAFVDDRGVGYAFESPGKLMRPLPSASGFVGARTDGHIFPVCTETEGYRHHYARIFVGGPEADPLLEAVNRAHGVATRAVTGRVEEADGTGRADVRVHVVRADDTTHYITRTKTDASGNFVVHVPTGVDVNVYAFVMGEALVGPDVVPAADADSLLTLPGHATLTVDPAVDQSGNPIPYKLQVIPTGGSVIPAPPSGSHWGEELPMSGRLHVAYALAGESVELNLPAGTWKVVASRGFRYELDETDVTVVAGGTATFAPVLDRSVDTPGVYCADFHIHTRRSNDSPDDPVTKLRSGLAEDLDVPVRSEHEYTDDWDDILVAPTAEGGLDSGAFAVGVTSVELSTMERFGHFGVIPAFEDETLPNGGAPLWQSFPNMSDLDREFRTFTPPELFASVHARPDNPALIINHPRGSTNYFGYAGYDALVGATGTPGRWSDDFEAIEVFNDASWQSERNRNVMDWLSFLNRGVHKTAVGSSDTHNLSGSPMGYARTCMDLGVTSLPTSAVDRRAFAYLVRDAVNDANAVVNGGIFVDASVTVGAETYGPGETVLGAGTTATAHLRVRAPMHVDVDTIEIIVDGVTYDTIDVNDPLACTQNGVVRCELDYPIPVAAQLGYFVVAAFGDQTLEPLMRSRRPFGATNAIFVER